MATATDHNATPASPPEGAKLSRRPSWKPVTDAFTRLKSNISLPKAIPRPSFANGKKSSPTADEPATPAASATPSQPRFSFDNARAPGQKKSDKRAERAALALRSWTFEVGSPPATASISKALSQLKSDLLNPIVGNKIILQLKTLSALYGPSATPAADPGPGTSAQHQHVFPPMAGPIHAVCLDCTDEEANEKIFNRLPRSSKLKVDANDSKGTVPSVQNADLNSVVAVLNDVHLVNLIEKLEARVQGLDLGSMFPGGGKDKDQVADGMMHMGEQLMALGFATSYAVFPDHKGVYPPTDRMSIITYWWGFELVIPPPSIKHLNDVVSISHAVLNFLTAISLVNAGVREIQPFIRYVAQYIDYQWASIKEKDKGEGVVCAAVWILPLALVSRPWDFAPKPPPKDGPKDKDDQKDEEKKPEETPIVEQPSEEKEGDFKISTTADAP